jgi:hypothetical protein
MPKGFSEVFPLLIILYTSNLYDETLFNLSQFLQLSS